MQGLSYFMFLINLERANETKRYFTMSSNVMNSSHYITHP